MSTRIIQIGFFGCGNVGSGVYKLITGFQKDLEHRAGVQFNIKKILVRSLTKVRDPEIDTSLLTTDVNDLLNDPEISYILEFLGGEEPANTWICKALSLGKTVITANKVALALHWHEMQKAARATGAGLYYEAAVCGAIPIIHTIEESLQANSIDLIYGIINGTTNYILSRMSKEYTDYETVLADAQKLGLAEPDPTNDVAGFDAAYKLSILSTLAFHGRIPFDNIYTEGITDIKTEDIQFGQKLGYTLKLLGIAKRNGLSVETHVHPTFIKNSHPMANVTDSYNAIFLHGHACNNMMFMGRGAGDMPTASAIVSDLLRASTAIKHTYPTFVNDPNPPVALINNPNWECAYYIRIIAVDESGVLSKILQNFAIYDVSIDAMQQLHAEDHSATIVLITHKTTENNIKLALSSIPKELAVIKSKIRVEND